MWKKISALVIPSLLAAGIIVFMLLRVWDDLLLALSHADYSFLVIAVLICVAGWFVRGERYRYILSSLSVRIGILLSTACIYISQTVNVFVPARLGDLVRLLILRHEVETPYSRGLSSLVVERFFDVITIGILGAVALPFLIGVPDWVAPLIALFLAACGAFVALLIVLGRVRSENRIVGLVLQILGEVREASLRPAAAGVIGLWSVVIWLFDIAVCYVIALMFGEAIPVMTVVLAIVLGNLVKVVQITPGGIGTYEAAVAATLELSGVSPTSAALIAIIDHLVKNLVTLGGGAVSLYMFGDWSVDLVKKAFHRSISGEGKE